MAYFLVGLIPHRLLALDWIFITTKCVTPSRRREANLSKRELRLPGEQKQFERMAVMIRDVDIRSELSSRACRPRDYESEHWSMAALAQEMAVNPRNMLQKLADTALELCGAETAGVSLLETEDGQELFRWEALAGMCAGFRNNTLPRAASPCGLCIDENATQLMYLPDRLFPALLTEPRFVEALLIPFHVQEKPLGAVWVVSHTEGRTFDREDERILRILAQFASAGWQLWKAVEQAEQANHRKDEFLAVLGHELRNPLSAISGAIGVMRKDGGRTDNLLRVAEILSRQTQQLSRIVGDLMDISRITTGKLELQKRENIDLHFVIEQAVETLRDQIERYRHRLTIVPPPAAIHMNADPLRLTQLLVNLVQNAVKYTPAGGHISIVTDLRDGDVQIKVRDSGIGLPKDKLTAIFDVFTQLPNGERSATGLGIGLRLVQTIAEMHGGTVEARSDGVGKGSEFVVTLPIAVAE
jgi:signal transduction histidine kinase